MSVPFGNVRWGLKESTGGRYFSIPGDGWSDVKSLDVSDTYPSSDKAMTALKEYVTRRPQMSQALKDVEPNKVVYTIDEFERSRDWDVYPDENNYICTD